MRTLIAACALAALLAAAPAAAQDPPVTLVYQGSLTDLAGAPVAATRAVTFRLYTAREGGEPVWSEAHAEVDVVDGSFTAVLGRREAIPFVAPGTPLYLGVQVDDDAEFSPRMLVGGVLRAQWAERAGLADDVTGHIHPAAVSIGDRAVIDEAGRWVGPTDGFGGIGPMGPQGERGPVGPQGAPGEPGPAGPQGAAGPAGAQGVAGPAGERGPAGADGAIGPAGPAGAQGVAGPAGERGPQGPAGMEGPMGPAGAMGPAGERGPAGPAGAEGPMGPQGPMGPAPAHEWEGTRLRFALQDGRFGPWAELVGPAGPAGAQGPAGTQGPAGPMGPPGPAGPEGSQGIAGARGPQGDPGPAGPAGERGAQGLVGERGIQGPQGLQGPPGPRGLPADPMDFLRDTDGDGFADWVEVAAGTDHEDFDLAPADNDGDGVADFFGAQGGGGGVIVGEPPRARYRDIAAGYDASCGVLADGRITCRGLGDDYILASPIGRFLTVSMFNNYACALREDGEAVCWGGDNDLAFVDPPAGPYVQVEAGINAGCGLRADGEVACWGVVLGNLAPPAGPFASIAVGTNDACALRDDGTVACWGQDLQDEVDAAPVNVAFEMVDLGYRQGCGVRAGDGTLMCWGYDRDAIHTPPAGSYVTLSINHNGSYDYACALRAIGTVRCWGSPPGYVRTEGQIVTLDSGYAHACGLRADDTVACWGRDDARIQMP